MPAKPEFSYQKMREQGLKPVQIWVPDVNVLGFRAEIRRQLRRLDPADEAVALPLYSRDD